MLCSVCGRETRDFEMCSECGRVYCVSCVRSSRSMCALGVCSDCEEAWQAEDDLQALEEEEEWQVVLGGGAAEI